VKGTKKALAMTLDGPGYRVARHPREGSKYMVAEACRNIVCSGARPLAATNCLNFGNPEHPEVMWQFREVVDGMSEACSAFGTPITGGNVSFYNETFGEHLSTPFRWWDCSKTSQRS
jgi:phosphoribosylformylglycinamidine synthase